MRDLHIVIVSWNVGALLERCLRSLPQACQGLDWHCVVVDNDSKDQSVAIAQGIAQELGQGRITVVEAGSNLGFAKGCNLGSHNAKARYYLYLNPDTECPEGSLAKLVREADKHPEAAILGPRLQYPDGSYQESIRRFPTFLDQAGIILKVSHFLPKLKIFQKYFARDLEINREQEVDQVMGACFLVRGEVVEQKLGFDERYFIWMEEVDYCKTVKQKGWTVRYIPSVSVIHHRGKSFAQEFQPRKQAYFTTSLKKYFDKWHPGPQAWAIHLLAPIGQVAVWLLYSSQQIWGKWLGLLLLVEIVSFASLYHSVVMSISAVILSGCMAFVAWKRPWIAISAILLEILIGSKGGILFVGEHPQTTSVRILLVAAFLFGWLLNIFTSPERKARIRSWSRFLQGRWAYLILASVIIWGVMRGWMLGNGQTVFKDANAWGFWIMLLPLLDIVNQHGEAAEKQVKQVLVIGLSWLAAKTLLISYIFSHGLGIAPRVYPWVRRTGIGEITLIAGNFFRVFFQSHVYAVFGVIALTIKEFSQTINRKPYLLGSLIAVLVLGLSRSFWIGTVFGLVLSIGLYLSYSEKTKQQKKPIKQFAIAGLIGICLSLGSVMIPIPPVDIASLSSVFGNRADGGEAAVVSRWNLLSSLEQKIRQHPIIGSGFGAVVTYQTKDPRIVKQTGGTYTTYAYEWGWLEHWVKFGLIGIPLMAWLVFSLAYRLWKSPWSLEVRISSVAILAALAAIHVFTPYLNHPLGISVLLFGEALVERGKRMVQW
jgi:GT2 family glycosyltransferase